MSTLASKRLSLQSEKLPQVKVMMLGDSGVGKSSIMNRYTDNSFEESMMSTAGVDYKSKTLELDGRRLKLALWDTAGQERFNTVTNAYYRGAQGIVLVYDCTDQSSFNNIEAWLRNITLHASEDVEKILIANKTDMFHTRQVSTERGADLAADNGLPFMEVSAKANTGVTEAFNALLRNIVKNHGDVLERAAAAAGSVPVDRAPASADERKCCS